MSDKSKKNASEGVSDDAPTIAVPKKEPSESVDETKSSSKIHNKKRAHSEQIDLSDDDEVVDAMHVSKKFKTGEVDQCTNADAVTYVLNDKVETLVIKFDGKMPRDQKLTIEVRGSLGEFKVEPPAVDGSVNSGIVRKFIGSLANIGFQTTQGMTFSNGTVTINGNRVTTAHDSSCASVNVNVTGNVKGKISTLGGYVQCQQAGNVETTSGDVTVLGNVQGTVSTMSGDVHSDGYIGGNASTMSGNVRASTISGNVSTMSGSVKRH